MTARPIIIDCDPGVDDAVMLMMALASPALDVRAITTVAGNVPLRLTSRNARMMCQIMDRPDVPVFAGCPRPILREPVTAEHFHGDSGIAGLEPFEPDKPLAAGHAVTHLIDTLRSAASGEYTIVVTGPLTNVATAIVMAPDIARGIDQFVIMGGADSEGGNITPTAEFNIFADPHAAGVVFDSAIPTTLLSLDVTHQVRAEPERLEQLRKLPGARPAIMVKLLEAANVLEARWKEGRMTPMHDPSTIAYLLAPHLFESRKATVSVDTAEGAHFGQTRLSAEADGPHTWVTKADADGFFALVEGLMTPS
ncbi:MAG: nucleoside hydrolase [Hyphomonas oceanitis]|uniref:nucleoside hydrolase n=1 Tax=Hyphomonas oceanitis TaxID=81033 RepID=UPI0030032A12